MTKLLEYNTGDIILNEGDVGECAYIIEKGQLRYSGTMAELAANPDARQQYLSI